MQGYIFDLYLQCQQNKTDKQMDTKTAKRIAKDLEEQAKMIRVIVKDYKTGVTSSKGYKDRLDTNLTVLEAIVKEFEFYQKIKDAVNKDLL